MLRGSRRHVPTFVRLAFALILIACAIGFIWDVSAYQATDVAEARYAADNHAARAENEISGKCAALPPSGMVECIEEAVKSSREDQRGEFDLQAQRQAARWTMIAGAAASLGFLVSIVGVGLVWTTFRETRKTNVLAMREHARSTRRAIAGGEETAKAIHAANTTAKAMEASNVITRELSRAWIAINCEFTACSEFQGTLFVDGNLIFKNVGKSPARAFQQHSILLLNNDQYADKLIDFFERAGRVALVGGDALMPNEEISIGFQFETEIDESDYFEDEGFRGTQVFVAASVQYRSPGLARKWSTAQTARCFILKRVLTSGVVDRGLAEGFTRIEGPNMRAELFDVGRTT